MQYYGKPSLAGFSSQLSSLATLRLCNRLRRQTFVAPVNSFVSINRALRDTLVALAGMSKVF